MSAPLSSLKILDFSTLLPGPCATMMLADMGAQVLRIESPTRTDLLRVVPPMVGEVSASHAYLNRGKRSLTLDLKQPQAVDIVRKLILEYDIVVEQFRPGVMQRLGLDYETLKAINPRLIYCSITGYGQSGPYRDRPGHDINYLALAGVSSYSGRVESGPAPFGVQTADVAGGSHHAVMGILAAVVQRQVNGEGRCIDISMSDAALAMNHMAMAGYLATAKDPQPEEEILNGGGCYDYYRTQDGRYLSVGALEPQFAEALCRVLDIPQMLPLMLSPRERDRQTSKKKLTKIFLGKTLAEWERVFASIEACVEPVLTLSEAEKHPHFNAREMFCQVSDAEGVSRKQLASPIKFEGDAFVPGRAGAALGQHSREVLTELGFNDAEIDALMEQGVSSSPKKRFN
ncbi:CoA transferase [Hahella sp. KA22]|uniref:CaiB/BaiF CoA transferase family protein n=1 Tax=Hahella sp. KA22 TaxID=1628392 RepID=UPI000FDE92FE|nr:CaiB/BaiF CoA-transferase family protein [Hahella sp. KA22]AZZ91456.1 CoA transferase [Hahella sp. KA22]QAY54825.1 CoA transferase [Hahella sp. KA22]